MFTTRTIALDLSLTGTGYSDGEAIEVWKTDTLRGHERLDHILSSVLQRIEATQPESVFIEGFSFGSTGRSVYQIGGLGFLVRHRLWEMSIPYCEVPPSVLKKYATGRGNAGKPEMLESAIRRFDYNSRPDDNMVDAFLLWHLSQELLGTPQVQLPKDHALDVSKVQWVKRDSSD